MMNIPTLAILAVALIGTTAHGALLQVNSRGALGGDDLIDWGPLGAPFTLVSNPININSQGGIGVTVSETGGSFQRRDQGAAGGWTGNFAAGDELLWTRTGAGPVSFAFVSNITGFGVNVNDNSASPGTATIEAFNSANVSLGSFVIPITATTDPSGATFVGLISDSQNIARITVNTTVGNFAVNQADLLVNASAIPEPSTVALFGLGLAGIAATRRRQS